MAPSGAEALDPVAGGLQLGGFGFELLEGLLDIGDLDPLEVLAACGVDAVCHGRDDAVVDKLIDPAGITEVGLLQTERFVYRILHGLNHFIGEDVLIALQQVAGNLHQLISRVVIELIAVGEPA